MTKLLFPIILLAIFLRFFMLSSVPNGLYQDETSIGYNAYSILKTGKDEYGKNFPLYFKAFGDQKLPVYIYSAVPSIAIFGLTPFAVRFPSAFFGVLSVIMLYFFVWNLTRDKSIAIVSSFLLAINPWSIFYNRATFEVSIALFFFLLGGFLLNKFFIQNTKGAFILGIVSFMISFYSYNLTRLLAPVLFLTFIYNHRKNFKKTLIAEIIFGIIIGILLLIPFFKSFLDSGGIKSASGTLIFSSAVVQAPLLELRAYMVDLPYGLTSVFFNKYILTLWQYILNIYSYFSVEFLFLKGSNHGNHGIGNFGLFYLYELPILIAGIYYGMRLKIRGINTLLSWGAVVILVASLTREAPHATRSYFLVVPIIVFSAIGVVNLYKKILKIKLKDSFYLKFIIVFIIFFLSYNFVFYFLSYYYRFPVLFASDWRAHDRDIGNFLYKNSEKYETVIIDKDSNLIYTSILFYTKYNPSDFQTTVKRFPDDSEGFSKVRKFGKYEYRTIDWVQDVKLPNSLLIASSNRKPENYKIAKEFFFPGIPSSFAKNQEIFSIFQKKGSYVLVETNN